MSGKDESFKERVHIALNGVVSATGSYIKSKIDKKLPGAGLIEGQFTGISLTVSGVTNDAQGDDIVLNVTKVAGGWFAGAVVGRFTAGNPAAVATAEAFGSEAVQRSSDYLVDRVNDPDSKFGGIVASASLGLRDLLAPAVEIAKSIKKDLFDADGTSGTLPNEVIMRGPDGRSYAVPTALSATEADIRLLETTSTETSVVPKLKAGTARFEGADGKTTVEVGVSDTGQINKVTASTPEPTSTQAFAEDIATSPDSFAGTVSLDINGQAGDLFLGSAAIETYDRLGMAENDGATELGDGTARTGVLVQPDGTTFVDGTEIALSDVFGSVVKAQEQLTDFLSVRLEESADWFTAENGLQTAAADWFGANLSNLVHGDLEPSEALVDLAQYLGQRYLRKNLIDPTIDEAKALISEVLMDAFNLDEATASALPDDIEGALFQMAETFIFSSQRWDTEQYVKAGLGTLAGVVSSRLITKFLGDGTSALGATAAVAEVIGTLMADHDLDTSDWILLGVNAGLAAGTAIAAVEIGSLILNASVASGNPVVIVVAAVLSLVADEIVSSIYWGKRFGPEEAEDPRDLFDRLFQVMVDENGDVILMAIQEEGATLIGRDGEGIAVLLGGDGNDTLVDTDEARTLSGEGGADYLEARGGDDTVLGGDGDDTLLGGAGDDHLQGDSGDDRINGGDGADTLLGGTGDDTLTGGAGDDNILGDDGADRLAGGGGDDVLLGGEGNDILLGGFGANVMGGEGGDDIIVGGASVDIVEAGDGNDHVSGLFGNDRLAGGAGDDLLAGDEGDDHLRGGTGDDLLDGGAGDDAVEGGEGADVLLGGSGDDFVSGGFGNDAVLADDGDDLGLGGLGDDLLDGGAGSDDLRGGAGNDILLGGAGDDLLAGGSGDDLYVHTIGADGIDRITDSEGNDTLLLIGTMPDAVSMRRENADIVFSVAGSDVISIDNSTVERIAFEDGSAYDLNVWATAGALPAPLTNAGGEAARVGASLAEYGDRIWTIENREGFTHHLDALEAELTLMADFVDYNAEYTISYKDKRGFFGGHYTKYRIERDKTINGTETSDLLVGSWWNETINGLAGDDTIFGNGGSDLLLGGAGEDILSGGSSGDRLEGGEGDDTLSGDGQNDILIGDAGDDTLHGGAGDDELLGDRWDTVMQISDDAFLGTIVEIITPGPTGNDTIFGDAGDDLLQGGRGDDELDGGEGVDLVVGGMGADLLHGGDGDDTLWGDEGDDTANGGDGIDRVYGGDGNDILSGGGGNDILLGDAGNDTIVGDVGDDSAYGGEGDDRLFGGKGEDLLLGDAGNDEIDGGDGDDRIFGYTGDDIIRGGAGEDNLAGEEGDDEIHGGDDDDVIFGDHLLDAGRDRLFGDGGNDLIRGGALSDEIGGGDGDDALYGDEGDDAMRGGIGDDRLFGGTGDDVMHGDEGEDSVRGGVGNDTLYGGVGDDRLFGLTDDDMLYGGTGADALFGDEGDDVVMGDDGDDALSGWTGNDTLEGNRGNDVMHGEDGNDILKGGDGDDTLYGDRAPDPVRTGPTAETLMQQTAATLGYENFGLLYQGQDYTVDALAAAEHRMLIINPASHSVTSTANSEILWTAEEITQIGADGKTLVGYFNVANVNSFTKDTLWDPSWTDDGRASGEDAASATPEWLGPRDPVFPETRAIMLLDDGNDEWLARSQQRLREMIDQGFDGVFLDDVLKYYEFYLDEGTDRVVEAAAAMRDFIVALVTDAQTYFEAKRGDGSDFHVIANGAPYIIWDANYYHESRITAQDNAYFEAIDVILVENFFRDGTDDFIDWTSREFGDRGIGLLSLDSDVVSNRERIEQMKAAVDRGFLPFVTSTEDYGSLDAPLAQDFDDTPMPGDDVLFGGAGSDALSGGAGNDFLIGGVSFDATNTAGAQVYRIYQATLDRAPDTGGFEGWTNQLNTGAQNLQQIVTGFVGSAEFQNTYGSLNNTDFVTLLYNNVLGRGPDSGGLNGWVNAMNNGLGREQVVTGFSESTEFKNNTKTESSAYAEALEGRALSVVYDDVFRLYQATLDRAPDQSGLEGWSGQLAGRQAYTTVASGFTGSAEFSAAYGNLDNAAFVDQLYFNVLDREADAGGRDGWLGLINNGGTREDVVEGFAQSVEFVDKTAASFKAYMKAAGGDTLDGGAGDDTLYGGLTADTFIFNAAEDGVDKVLQLDTWDTLKFEGFGYGTAADALAQMSVAGRDVNFADQGVTITFSGADLATVQEVDYLFV